MAVAVLVGAGLIVGWQMDGRTSPGTSSATGTGSRTESVARTPVRRRLGSRSSSAALGAPAAPVQDAAVAGLDRRRVLLLGGLTASDTSTGAILLAAGASSRPLGQLPTTVHDARTGKLLARIPVGQGPHG